MVACGTGFVEILLSVVDLVRALVPDFDLIQGQAHKTHEDASAKKHRRGEGYLQMRPQF